MLGESGTEWAKTGTKTKKVYHCINEYKKHFSLLEKVFLQEESPSVLKQSRSMRLGVYTKNVPLPETSIKRIIGIHCVVLLLQSWLSLIVIQRLLS